MTISLVGVGSIVLPEPALGNETTYEFNGAQSRTTGGTYVAVKDPSWPNFNTFTYNIALIDTAKKEAMITFLEDNAALDITLTDHRGIVRLGQIANNSIEFITLDATGCSYSFSFLFLTQVTP